jgi:hypothetical protein
MRESFRLTHNFIIIKIHTYHQGNMFQLQEAIIRPLYKNTSLTGIWCMIGIQIVYITGYCCIQCSNLVKNKVKMQDNVFKWSIVLIYTI